MSVDPLSIITILGSVVGGIGEGMMEKSRMKAEEKAKIAEEKRREERYAGVGDAMAFWDDIDTQPDDSVAAPYTNPHKKKTTPLGQTNKPPQVGDKYKKKAPQLHGFNALGTTP